MRRALPLVLIALAHRMSERMGQLLDATLFRMDSLLTGDVEIDTCLLEWYEANTWLPDR
jgi:hypothetical protein